MQPNTAIYVVSKRFNRATQVWEWVSRMAKKDEWTQTNGKQVCVSATNHIEAIRIVRAMDKKIACFAAA